ncbi:response regulator [Flavobacterium sp.]|jgi:CheY-like chemotaxis protein|uniref:response regulator n=1 Tax=Flavobacterium sp. TaxID=239 RepID=UPI0033413C40
MNTHFYIIDDDELFLKLGKMYLEMGNCTSSVTLFNDASQALNVIETIMESVVDQRYVIFLDLNMPILNGFGFLEALEKKPKYLQKNIQIYVLTSSINHEDIERIKQYKSVTEYLNKPMTREMVQHVCAS